MDRFNAGLSHVKAARYFFALALIMLALAACTLADEPEPAGPVQVGPLEGQESKLAPVLLPDLADGAQTFAEHCAACHGETGKGDGERASIIVGQGGAVPDFTDPAFARSKSPFAWFTVITEGNIAKLMPPWGQTLTDQQRWNAAYYLTTLSVSDETRAAGKAAYETTCQSCHGVDGTQNGLTDARAMAALSAQDIVDQRIVGGGDGVHVFGDQIDEETRWAVAAYVRSFSYDARSLALAEVTPTPTVPPTATPTLPPTEAPTLEGTPGTLAPTTDVTATPESATPEPTATPAGVFGSVTGRVINGTSGASVPPGLSVTLSGLALDASGSVVEFTNLTTTIDSDGAFHFDDLPLDQGQSAYVVTTNYNDLEFRNFTQVDPATAQMDLPVTIYETTTDPSVVTLDAVHYFFSAHQDSLLVVQVMIFSNSSDKAYITTNPVPGGLKAGVSFAVPSDASTLSFDTGALGTRFIQSGDTVFDTEPLLPGPSTDTVSATYIVPYTAGGRDFTFPVQYQTTLANVLIPTGMQLSGPMLTKGEDTDFQGQTLSSYEARAVQVGQTFTFHISPAVQTVDLLRIVLAVVLILLIISAIVYWFMRRRYELAAPVLAGGEGTEALLRQIAALDEDFREGKINRLDYEALRADLKAQIAEHMEQ